LDTPPPPRRPERDLRRGEAEPLHHAAQEAVRLAQLQQRVHRLRRHQPVIRRGHTDVGVAEQAHHAVEELRREALDEPSRRSSARIVSTTSNPSRHFSSRTGQRSGGC